MDNEPESCDNSDMSNESLSVPDSVTNIQHEKISVTDEIYISKLLIRLRWEQYFWEQNMKPVIKTVRIYDTAGFLLFPILSIKQPCS